MNALEITDLSKTYKNGLAALKGIDLSVPPGDFYALLGPNGAGKSTTIGIIVSLVRKTGGSVQVFGYDTERNPSEAKSFLGIVPQEFNFAQFDTVLNIVVNQAGYYGIPRRLAHRKAEQYLTQLGLWEKRKDQARMLSGGLKRRLMIARALLHEPKLLILDEPTAGVDIESRRAMWDFLRDANRKGTTIILTTHYLEEAESLCRNIAIIDQGQIVEDTSMRNLLTQLHQETFILDLKHPLAQPVSIDGYALRPIDAQTIEADVNKEEGVNRLFAELSAKNIEVASMRNKTNRLEETFVRMLEESDVQAPV